MVSAGDPRFGEAARAAVQTWSFSPATEGQKLIAMSMHVPFEFDPAKGDVKKPGRLPPMHLLPKPSPSTSADVKSAWIDDYPESLAAIETWRFEAARLTHRAMIPSGGSSFLRARIRCAAAANRVGHPRGIWLGRGDGSGAMAVSATAARGNFNRSEGADSVRLHAAEWLTASPGADFLQPCV